MRNPALPGLSSLRCFESAARHLSFTSAAEELRITQSAVSKKVRELESVIGVTLFIRAGRGVALTAAGETLARTISFDLAKIQTSVEGAIAAAKGKQVLSIATLPTFANLWLIPLLPGFAADHQDVEVHLNTRMDPFDFDADSCELAIHYGLENWPNTRMTRLFGEIMIPVCSPEFFEKFGLSDQGRLITAPLLHLKSRPQAWEEWLGKLGQSDVPQRHGLRLDQYSMVISAALAGLGAAIVPASMVGRELSSNSLVRVEGQPLTSEKSYFLVRPHGPQSEPARRFENWIRKQVRNTERIGMS